MPFDSTAFLNHIVQPNDQGVGAYRNIKVDAITRLRIFQSSVFFAGYVSQYFCAGTCDLGIADIGFRRNWDRDAQE